MKTLKVNGVEQQVTNDTLILDDYLNELTNQLSSNSEVIASIKVNGHEISETEESELRKKTLSNIDEIEVITSNPKDLAYETLLTLEQYIDKMAQTVRSASQYYQDKNYVLGDQLFAKSIDSLDLFVQTIGGIKLALKIGLHPELALVEADLVGIMNEILSAKRSNNYIYISELLTQDLVQNLESWKNEVFPFLRRFRNN